MCDGDDRAVTMVRSPVTSTHKQMAAGKRLAVNVVMNWASTAVNMVVPFFLTPFVVRHLGSTGYGVWILAVSTVGYLNLLDLGLRSAVVRFVSKAQARGEEGEARKAILAALWFRVFIATAVAAGSILLAAAVPHFYKIPADMMHAAQITTLLCALGVAVSLVSGVWGAVLAATHRFDLLSYINMAQTLTRAGGVLLILHRGLGLVPLAAWELTVLLFVGLLTAGAAMLSFAPSRVRLAKPESAVLRSIWSYSFTTFIFVIAVQIITGTDNIVVGAFLSVSVVTFYAIAGSLTGYAYQVSGALAATFVPMASNLEASGKPEKLRTMLIRGTQATLGLALPISVGLFFRGGTFIRLWMGPQYAHTSEHILRILMLSMFFGVADGTAGSIMMAIERHKPMARWAVYEAVLNLALSILLVRRIGIYGVAWGTSISMLFTHLAFWPRYVKKILHVPVKTYLLEGWGKISICVVPFALACAWSDRHWTSNHLVPFFVQILILLPLYAVCVVGMFWGEVRDFVSRWRASRKQAVLQIA